MTDLWAFLGDPKNQTTLSWLGGGLVVLEFIDLPDDDPHRERTFSEHLACVYDDLSFEELEPRSFSFNSPYGACVECHGGGEPPAFLVAQSLHVVNEENA